MKEETVYVQLGTFAPHVLNYKNQYSLCVCSACVCVCMCVCVLLY